MLTFDALFSPHGGNCFAEQIMGQAALYVAGTPGKLDHLFSWADLNHLLEFGGLSYPRLRLIRGGQELSEGFYLRARSSGYQRPLVRELTAQLSDGAMLAIQSIEELHAPISVLCEMLESRLRIPVQADLFANCHDTPVAPLRWNDQDVIVMQIEGRREWRIYCPTTRITPAATDTAEPTGEPAWRGVLNTHDLLYLPRGWWHFDSPLGDHALCLGLRFRNPTDLDVVARLTQRLAIRSTMNKDIPRFGRPERLGNVLAYIQQELEEVATEPGLLLSFLAEMQHLAEPRTCFCLPWSAQTMPMAPPKNSIVLPLLRFPEAGSVMHSESEDTCQIIVDGQPVTFSEDLASIIELILDRRNLSVGSLVDECAPEIPSERVMECLTALVKCGAVCLREGVQVAGPGAATTGPPMLGDGI